MGVIWQVCGATSRYGPPSYRGSNCCRFSFLPCFRSSSVLLRLFRQVEWHLGSTIVVGLAVYHVTGYHECWRQDNERSTTHRTHYV